MPNDPPVDKDDFWFDTRQRDAMLADVLRALLRHGPMNDENIARFCLNPQDLFGAMPEDVKDHNARKMVEAMINYLDGPMSINSFAESLANWRQSIQEARGKLDWSKLPPVTHRLALCYASKLTEYAQRQGWVMPSDNPLAPGWQITEKGMAAAEQLKDQLA